MTDEELSEVERQVNEKTLAGMNVNISEMPVDEAESSAPWRCSGKNTARLCGS